MDDQLECGYHGLVYDCTGNCVKIPGQSPESIPPGARVRSYPVVDRHFYLWIWMGDPARADPALIPDFSALEAPGVGRHRIKLHLLCTSSWWSTTCSTCRTRPTCTARPRATRRWPRTPWSRPCDRQHGADKRWMWDVMPAPTFVHFGGYEGRVNLWQVSEYAPPSYVRVSYGSSDAGVAISEDDDIWTRHVGFQRLSRTHA